MCISVELFGHILTSAARRAHLHGDIPSVEPAEQVTTVALPRQSPGVGKLRKTLPAPKIFSLGKGKKGKNKKTEKQISYFVLKERNITC
jgi:hypothetical protein